MNDRPSLSVIVAASDSAGAVARCLASLRRSSPGDRVEWIVAAARNPIVGETSPGVAWVAAPSGTGVPRLRHLGAERATGDLLAFAEDSCLYDPGWARAWIDAFDRREALAATGPVEHADGRSALDWAVFFCEYAPFLAPLPVGSASRLAGNNFAVRRRAIADGGRSGEVHESALGHEVRSGGRVIAAAARARHVRRFGPREAIRDRLRFGYEFGALRREGGATPRPLVLLAGPAVLLAQMARLAATLLSKRRLGGPFLESLPITLALLTAWSVGEWAGWVAGRRPSACK